MKELSIEQKAEAYDKAIEMAKEYFDSPRTCIDINVLPKLFPELKESEDEGIRKSLIGHLKECRNNTRSEVMIGEYAKWISWLEKQIEQKPNYNNKELKDVVIAELSKYNSNDLNAPWATDSTGLQYPLYFANLGAKWQGEQKPVEWSGVDNAIVEGICLALEYSNESGEAIEKYENWLHSIKDRVLPLNVVLKQKPADMEEPKFKVGYIITNGKIIGKVDENENNKYHGWFGYDKDLSVHYADIPDVENWHLWTIQDAKDGDVLACGNDIVIFKENNYNPKDQSGCMFVYCAFNKCGYWYEIGGINPTYYKPATKEQRDTLMKAMADAGYMWDAGKKKLKKIVTPIFHIGDRVRYKGCACDGVITEITDTDYICGNAKLPISTQDKLELVEQKPDDNIDSSSFKDKLLKLFQKFRYIKEGMPTNGDIIDYVDAHIQELIDTIQNKLVWSEEEKRNTELLISLCKNEVSRLKEKGSISEEWYEIEEAEDWLKSLKDRVQPQSKQVWSEEDCNQIETIACHLDNTDNEGMAEVLRNIRDKYYHIIPQSQWKPSDEQMEVLNWCKPLWNEPKTKAVLESLIEDLKKLREG